MMNAFAAEQPAESLPGPQQPVKHELLDRLRIMIVEDEQVNAFFVEAILKHQNYRITANVTSGEEAVEKALALHPDLILMDIMLSGAMNGIEAVHEIQKKERIPVIFMSACTDNEIILASKDTNPYGYLLKPFDVNDLTIAIEMALYRYGLEKKLIESEKRFRLLFEQESDGIVIFDTESRRIFDINDATISLYGYSREQLIGQDLLLLMDGQNYAALYRAFTTNYEGSPFILLRQEHRRKDGMPLPVSCRGRIIDMNGRKHLFCSIRDCTEKLRQEEESALLQAQFMQSEKMASVGVLAAGIAHEINNPMAFISSNLSTMEKYLRQILPYIGFLEETARKNCSPAIAAEIQNRRNELKIEYVLTDAVDLIAESASGAERVKKIVQDLKLFTRADDSELKLFDIHECMENTINIVWNELKYKATLKKDYGDIPLVLGHPQQLSQVFMNLLINAAHALGKEGLITIRTWLEDTTACISVADTGCGISEKNLGKIFEPFFTTKEVGKGSGLGLSIAYDIVTKKHNGKIFVASEVGKGTTFTIKLNKDNRQD